MEPLHQNVARVLAAATAAGLALEVRHFPDRTATAQQAAEAVGVGVGQIVKSLIFAVDGAPVVALVSGSNRLDEARLAAAAGGATVGRVDAEAARAATGFPIGGVPPFGHVSPLPVFVDEDLLAYEVLWAAAGTPHDNFPISPADLVRVSAGVVCTLRPDPVSLPDRSV